MFDFFDGMFGVYFPLVNSKNINTVYDGQDNKAMLQEYLLTWI